MTAAASDDFVTRLVDVARAAMAAGPARTLTLRPAGVPVRVHLAGEELIDRLAPGMLEGLIVADERPAVELWAFDGAGSGRAAPRPPWGPDDYLQREEIAGWTRPPRLASYSNDYATLSVAATEAGLGVQWLRDATVMAPWEGGAPLRSILRWTLARHGAHLIHAAAVGTGADGVLLLGSGGAGKSTTALACLQAGMALVSDDYTLIRPGSPPTAHPAFAIAKAGAASLELLGGGGDLPARAAGARVDWRGKLRLPIADVVCPSLALRAVVLPHVAEQTGAPVRVSGREALRTIAVSTLLQLPGDSATTLTVLRELLATLPVYTLDVGPDVAAIPEAISALIETLAAEAAA
jgi:hypothetical protein